MASIPPTGSTRRSNVSSADNRRTFAIRCDRDHQPSTDRRQTVLPCRRHDCPSHIMNAKRLSRRTTRKVDGRFHRESLRKRLVRAYLLLFANSVPYRSELSASNCLESRAASYLRSAKQLATMGAVLAVFLPRASQARVVSVRGIARELSSFRLRNSLLVCNLVVFAGRIQPTATVLERMSRALQGIVRCC